MKDRDLVCPKCEGSLWLSMIEETTESDNHVWEINGNPVILASCIDCGILYHIIYDKDKIDNYGAEVKELIEVSEVKVDLKYELGENNQLIIHQPKSQKEC